MTHKKKYMVNGDKISEYNKNYYLKHRKKLLKRALKRLAIKRMEVNRMKEKKLSNKEIMDLVIKMVDDAKGTIKEDRLDILEEDDGLTAISYDLLWISALPNSLNKAAGSCPSGIKDDTMLLKLLLPFKRLKEINKHYIKSDKVDEEIENIIDELDDIANEIVDSELK